MIRARFIALAATLGLAAASAPASACSVSSDYRVPTNLELARDAELILLARVTGEAPGEEEHESAIAIAPLAALKGDLPPDPLTLGGHLMLAEGEAAGYGVLSNPTEFEAAHPVSYIGACIRYVFPRGTTVLFFLDESDHRWVPSGGAFSRWAEDVPGPDAPWVALTRLYVRAAALPESEARALLETERDRLRERGEDPVNRLMADDIDRQLAGPNETWNAQMERELGLGPWEEDQPEAMDERPPDTLIVDLGDEPQAVTATCEPAETDADEAALVATVRQFFELGDSGRFAEIGPLLVSGALARDVTGETLELAEGLTDASRFAGGPREQTELLETISAPGAVAVKVRGNLGSREPAILAFSFSGQCIAGMQYP